ncbi:MAG: YedE family putative selenium transporter [Desulfuromonadales bacterium]|nr:YedE family putative selenium transporter [Desulfuromonadales bacterium]
MNWRDRHLWLVILAGGVFGVLGVMLSVWGNPANSGICVSCFLENSVGALGFHDNDRMQYLRPELPGFVLGATVSALIGREFVARGGGAPLPRIVAGILLMIGCAIFIGCPIKLFLRLSAGDLTALAGVAGLICGVWIGLQGLGHGVSFGQPLKERGTGWITPLFFLALLAAFFVRPGFLLFSERGSASLHAPWFLSLGAGLVLGGLAQRTRFCITGGIRDGLILGRRAPLLWGGIAFIISAFLFSILVGRFNVGWLGQPGAHLETVWNFTGMLLVGIVSALIGGCPLRQLIKSGEGDTDAGLVVIGMLIGAALVQAWGITATAAGVPSDGKIAVLTGLALTVLSMLLFRERETE